MLKWNGYLNFRSINKASYFGMDLKKAENEIC